MVLRPVWFTQGDSAEEYCIRLVLEQNRLCLSRIGDEANSAHEDVDFVVNPLRQRYLITRTDRDICRCYCS